MKWFPNRQLQHDSKIVQREEGTCDLLLSYIWVCASESRWKDGCRSDSSPPRAFLRSKQNAAIEAQNLILIVFAGGAQPKQQNEVSGLRCQSRIDGRV